MYRLVLSKYKWMKCEKCQNESFILTIDKNDQYICDFCEAVKLNKKQLETKVKIEFFARLFEVDPAWAISVAMVESSLGLKQESPTKASGVFHITSIAMRDLLLEMKNMDDDLIDIVCGIAFLRLLKKRWGTIEEATNHYCDPRDRGFYLAKVKKYMDSLRE